MGYKKSELYKIGRKAMEAMIDALENNKPLTRRDVVSVRTGRRNSSTGKSKK
jgi:DNA-binding LacI/PurR family transcriptional regulator